MAIILIQENNLSILCRVRVLHYFGTLHLVNTNLLYKNWGAESWGKQKPN